MKPALLDADEATRCLGISRATLYAYVSRGLVRAVPDPGDPRRRRYDRRDIDALLDRRRVGRARQSVAASTIDWGEPVLASAITAIRDGQVWYRGHDAAALAGHAALEQVAALLCGAPAWPLGSAGAVPAGGEPIGRAVQAMAGLALPAVWSRGAAALHRDGAAVLATVAAAVAGRAEALPAHALLAQAWGLDARGAELVRRALVLVADHELNVSAFTVRVVASSGASLAACVLAGLCALQGPLHGGVTGQVRAMLDEPGMTTEPAAAIARRLARGERLPGFGHPLYPDGDPRAANLLAALDPPAPWPALIAAAEAAVGQRANIDIALAALEHTLGLPAGAAIGIFAAGRAAGWIAHALEQQATGALIRPRASYAGPAPGEGPALPGA
jgi:citrate synthase